MKLILITLLLFGAYAYSQEVKLLTERDDKIPLQAVLDLETSVTLFAGQEYHLFVTASLTHDITLSVTNAKIDFVEESKRGTGGLMYILTPIDTGVCYISIGNAINSNTSVSLLGKRFRVVDYPMPPIYVNGASSGEIIDDFGSEGSVTCHYSTQTGVFDEYEVVGWEVIIGEKVFAGTGAKLSDEVIQFVSKLNSQYVHVKVKLSKNKTGYQESEAIYLVRRG